MTCYLTPLRLRAARRGQNSIRKPRLCTVHLPLTLSLCPRSSSSRWFGAVVCDLVGEFCFTRVKDFTEVASKASTWCAGFFPAGIPHMETAPLIWLVVTSVRLRVYAVQRRSFMLDGAPRGPVLLVAPGRARDLDHFHLLTLLGL